ncbi:GDSL esterase/lipase [Apostasia shenzhenica]|uniref:GDSL esterase/lipase n=1 Tax=Apostasia shenzhenica TaxID=1088818 RepID=A0A2I0AU41_9ASPA|nr:GDSL esterase/lipase [Apostasia shenzhenica]
MARRHTPPPPASSPSISMKLAFSIALSLLLLPPISLLSKPIHDNEAEVQGMFVFGSSLVDNGNNNFLKNSSAKADYLPYGIDFPRGPTGRFSNGRNAVDVLGELLRLPSFIPAFDDPRTRGRKIIHGVNFASGGSGILDQTGAQAGEVVSLTQQIRNFEMSTLRDLEAQLGCRPNYKHLLKYLFVLETGGNDYQLNYFAPGGEPKPKLPQFTSILVSKLTQKIKKLYILGARKFVMFSIQPIGCIPVARSNPKLSNNGSCIEQLNDVVLLFNQRLRSLVFELKAQLPDSNLVFVNSFNIIRDVIDNPHYYGFSDVSTSCCELSPRTVFLCKRGGRACNNRTIHVYFDGLHPTDAVNLIIGQKAYGSDSLEEAYPASVKQLANM